MEEILNVSVFDKVGTFAVLCAMCYFVITGKLIWHKQVEKIEERAERWEKVAIEALTAGAEAGVKAAEVAVDVVSALPDPQGSRQ